MYSGQPTAGDRPRWMPLAAVVVGGTSMSGGYGKLGGTLVDALIIGILSLTDLTCECKLFLADCCKGYCNIACVIDYIKEI